MHQLLLSIKLNNHVVNATIHAALRISQSGLSEGQMTNKIQGECTNLTFNIISPREYDNLIRILYALDGPCKDADLSRKVVK